MIEFINQTNINIDDEIIDFLNIIKNSITTRDVELIVVDKNEIKRLNKEFLNKDYQTDVLSFGLDFDGINIDNPPLGSIVISIDSAMQVADEFNHSLKEEFAILFTHAILHLLGFDHEIDNGEHREKEREILSKFNIKNPLIERNMN